MQVQQIEKPTNLCLCKRCLSSGYVIQLSNGFFTVSCPNNCNVRILSKNKDFVIATWNRENRNAITDYRGIRREQEYESSSIMR